MNAQSSCLQACLRESLQKHHDLVGVTERFLLRLFAGSIGRLKPPSAPDDTATRLTRGGYRTAAGSEVDVVVEKPDGSVAAIEVRASATVSATDFAALKALRDQLGGQFRAGVVIYLGEQIVPFGDKLWLVPAASLWAP